MISRFLLKFRMSGSRAFATVLLVPFIVMIGGCFDTYDVAELESDRDAILSSIERTKTDTEDMKVRLESLKKESAGAVEIQKGIEDALEEKRTKEQEIADFEVKLRGNIAVKEAAQESFKIKIAIEPGTKFESIILKNGKELKGATFKSFTLEAIKFAHSAGFGSYPLDQMPDVIAKYYILPPPEQPSDVDPLAVIDRKPHALMTYDQIKAARKKKYAAVDADSKKRMAKIDEARNRQAAARNRQAAATEMQAKKRKAEEAALQATHRTYLSASSKLAAAFARKESEWANMNIKPALKDRQSARNAYQRKKQELDNKIAAIQAQITKLQVR